MNHRSLLMFVAFGLWVTNLPAAEKHAEYSFRWETVNGGPSSLDEVAVALNFQGKDPKNYKVQYFAIKQKAKVPRGYTVIGRERGEIGEEEPDAMYKVRGREPGPPELSNWQCPLTAPDESKAEVDIGFLSPSDVKRVFSVSCKAEKRTLAASLPKGFKAVAKACASEMERTKGVSSGTKLTIEKWALPKGRTVIEVSMEGSDTDTDFNLFRDTVVKPLMDRGATPKGESKTELGSDC